jgi:hypothetical protein
MNAKWLAGFFEADGCVMTHGARHGRPQPTVSFTQKDPYLLEKAQAVIGGRMIQDKKGYYRLRITNREGVREFCKLVYPHLEHPKNKKQVKLAYQLGGLVGITGLRVDHDNRRARMALHSEIKRLKS